MLFSVYAFDKIHWAVFSVSKVTSAFRKNAIPAGFF